MALVVADAGQPYRRRRRAPCAVGHINRPASDIRPAGSVALEKLRLRLQHQRDRLSPSGRRREGSLWRPFYWRHVGYFGRLPVEGLPSREAGLLAVLLRKALPNLWRLEVRSDRRRLEDLGPARPRLRLRATLGLLSPNEGLGPKQVINAGEGAHDV